MAITKIHPPCSQLYFYSAWNPPFVILLWVSTLVDWYVAKALGAEESQNKRKLLLSISLITNLGLLGFFKCGGFLLYNFVELMHLAGISFEAASPNIILPVGISFYTFQTLSYTLDVYFKKEKPSQSFLDFCSLCDIGIVPESGSGRQLTESICNRSHQRDLTLLS